MFPLTRVPFWYRFFEPQPLVKQFLVPRTSQVVPRLVLLLGGEGGQSLAERDIVVIRTPLQVPVQGMWLWLSKPFWDPLLRDW